MPRYVPWDEEKQEHGEAEPHAVEVRPMRYTWDGKEDVGVSLNLKGEDFLVFSGLEVEEFVEASSDLLRQFKGHGLKF